MKAKDVLEICEELEDLAAVGKALATGTNPEGGSQSRERTEDCSHSSD